MFENNGYSDVPEEFINVFKSVKKLNIGSINSVSNFTNVENLSVESISDLTSLEKCTHLKELIIRKGLGLSVLQYCTSIVDL